MAASQPNHVHSAFYRYSKVVFRCRRLKRPISIAKSMYGYIRTEVTAGRHFRTDLSVPKSERVKVKIEACKLFAKFVHSPFGRLIHTFITNLTIYYKCWLLTTNVVCQLVHFTTTSQNPGEPQLTCSTSTTTGCWCCLWWCGRGGWCSRAAGCMCRALMFGGGWNARLSGDPVGCAACRSRLRRRVADLGTETIFIRLKYARRESRLNKDGCPKQQDDWWSTVYSTSTLSPSPHSSNLLISTSLSHSPSLPICSAQYLQTNLLCSNMWTAKYASLDLPQIWSKLPMALNMFVLSDLIWAITLS